MPKAIWKGTIVAESAKAVLFDGTYYFPPESVHTDYFEKTDTRTNCPWKGDATYYTIRVGEKTSPDVGWSYHEPKAAAMSVKDYFAFWRGVEVEE